MKPSERINQIEQLYRETGMNPLHTGIMSVIAYLDEEYEANQEAVAKLKKDLKPM